MKKEIIVGQNRSNSLSTLLNYFSNDLYQVRIAPNIEAVIQMEKEKASDFLIISAELLPEEITLTLTNLDALAPLSQLILTHTDGLKIKKQLAGMFPGIQLFDSHLEAAIPVEMISLFESKKSHRKLASLISEYIPQLDRLDQFVPSWLLS